MAFSAECAGLLDCEMDASLMCTWFRQKRRSLISELDNEGNEPSWKLLQLFSVKNWNDTPQEVLMIVNSPKFICFPILTNIAKYLAHESKTP